MSCLSQLIECHDDNCGAVSTDQFRLRDEVSLTFLQTDTVDNTLALCASESGLNHGKV